MGLRDGRGHVWGGRQGNGGAGVALWGGLREGEGGELEGDKEKGVLGVAAMVLGWRLLWL